MPIKKKMYVVYCEDHGTYWCGLNTWDDQLRKANVFHCLKYANEVHERFKELKLKNVEIYMDVVPENPTRADRIRAMSDEELAVWLVKKTKYQESAWSAPSYLNFLTESDDTMESAIKGTVEWLKQPCEGDI